MKSNFYLKFSYFSTMLLLLSSCAAKPKGEMEAVFKGGAGFWSGLWHGIILPFSLLGKVFNLNIGIHETYYSGPAYWFGFLFGLICLMKFAGFVAVHTAKHK